MNITICGAGAFGSALAHILQSNQHHTTFYDPIKFPDLTLSQSLTSADAIVLAVPSSVAPELLPQLPTHLPLICATKGFLSLAPFRRFAQFSVLSGPAFAADLLTNQPSQLVATSPLAAKLFSTAWLTITETTDTLGVLLCGALKNVYAISAGLQQLQPSSTAFAQFINTATAELRTILIANHCDGATASLPCGQGDLVLTCGSTKSRNYQFGQYLHNHQSVSTPDLPPAQTTEGLTTLHALTTTPGFILPPDTPLLHQIIKQVNS